MSTTFPSKRIPAGIIHGFLGGLAVSGSPLALVAQDAAPNVVPVESFAVPEGLEVTLWASSPMLHNPTNLDVDRDGRIWVAEGVNYRGHGNRRPEGDRIMVLEDTDGDGRADSSHVFVQEPFLTAPLGVAVLDNRVVVSMTPEMIVYTDVDRNLVFDPAVDRREVLLSGFENRQHDHTLHSVTAGPDGQWYWNCGNCGARFTDRSGRTFRISGAYEQRPYAGQPSDDGHVYVGGFSARMNPDGTGVHIIGHNYRNSYEQTVTSFGDVFQNDNDDPPACRVSFVMEYGNAGFSSFDGQRSWQADRRPWQSVAVAEWRQEDPGTMPAGDVYGGGSPTGVAFYENGALGPKWRGLLLTCEAGRNVVFGYHPEPEGAGFRLDRFDFLTSNPAGEFAGSDFLGGGGSVRRDDLKTLFRPSDVVVGADGAIYVADWFDPRVGGHQDLDDSISGAIYRVAPPGFRPEVPGFDLESTEGRIAALGSPAVNVRHLGFVRLRESGAAAVPAVAALLEDENPFLRARAVWLLSQMGEAGLARVDHLLAADDPGMRTVAFRAIRRAAGDDGAAVARLAASMVDDPSPAVRREAALAMRDLPFELAGDVLVALARGFDGSDRTYLEALGTGATGKEAAFYAAALEAIGHADPLEWSDAFAWIAWRLSVPDSVPALAARARALDLSGAQRRLMIDALAFIPAREAAEAMLGLAENAADPLRDRIVWWLFNRRNNDWREHGIPAAMKELGIYDPAAVELVEITVPDPAEPAVGFPPVDEILGLDGDPERGKLAAARCYLCHEIDGAGIDYGPNLTDFGRTQTAEVIAASILQPSAEISHGFDGWEIVTREGTRIHGLVIADGDPVIIKSTGGRSQTVPKDRIVERRKLGRSLMMTPAQLALTPRDVADLVAYLRSIGRR